MRQHVAEIVAHDADTLEGGQGNDQLGGGNGGDTLRGASGADTFFFASPNDGPDICSIFSTARITS